MIKAGMNTVWLPVEQPEAQMIISGVGDKDSLFVVCTTLILIMDPDVQYNC